MNTFLRNLSLSFVASMSVAAFAANDATNTTDDSHVSRAAHAVEVSEEALAFMVAPREVIAASITDEQVAQAVERACSQVNLDDGQRQKIKDLAFNCKKAKINLRAQIKTTMLDYFHLISQPASKMEDAQSLSQKAVSQKTELANLKANTLNEVFFKVLKVEQRSPALECAAAIMAARRAEASSED